MLVFCSAIQVTLQQGSDHLNDLSYRLFNRIDNIKSITLHVFNDFTEIKSRNSTAIKHIIGHAEIERVNKPAGKTTAVIFGLHDETSIKTAQRIASYFDTHWGSMRDTWTMYYLNGQDNSLTMISTLPLKPLLSQRNNSTLTRLISSRRAEMMQQAIRLDEHESFSSIRHLNTPFNNWFFTLRATYNQPSRLATVLAFDVPINDLVSNRIDINHLQLEIDDNPGALEAKKKITVSGYQFDPNNLVFEVTAAIPHNPLTLVYSIPLGDVLKTAFYLAYLPLITLLVISFGLFYIRLLIRQLQSFERSTLPETQTHIFCNISREIIQLLPNGFAIYDLRQAQVVLMNDRAKKILSGVNLTNLFTLSDEEDELLQISVDNDNYVIRQRRSEIVPSYHLLVISEPDNEQVITARLQNAKQLMETNQSLRKQLFKQLTHYLEKPLAFIHKQLVNLAPTPLDEHWQQLMSSQQQFAQLVHNIFLLNAIEGASHSFNKQAFSFQDIVDEQITRLHNQLNERNVQLLVHHIYPANHQCVGEVELLEKLFTLLLNYSFKSIEWGKVTLQISIDPAYPERILFAITDTSTGLSKRELQSVVFPFNQEIHATTGDNEHDLDLFLAGKLAEYFRGTLKIHTLEGIGTRYEVTLLIETTLPSISTPPLLAGMVFFLDIVTEETRNIAARHLENLGANGVISGIETSAECYDFLVTDNPNKLNGWALLLTGNAVPYRLPSNQISANYNIFKSVKDALTKLIEIKTATENMEETVEEQHNAIWMQSEYFQIFESTVPDDINKLYSEITRQDYTSLALTAHRLKGVFAMLNLPHGRILCEHLEHETQQTNDVNIKIMTSELDQYVRTLLQQGRK